MIIFKLDTVLKELQISRNAFSSNCGIRPNTINDMCNGITRRIEVDTLNSILECLNKISTTPIYLEDIIEFKV